MDEPNAEGGKGKMWKREQGNEGLADGGNGAMAPGTRAWSVAFLRKARVDIPFGPRRHPKNGDATGDFTVCGDGRRLMRQALRHAILMLGLAGLLGAPDLALAAELDWKAV